MIEVKDLTKRYGKHTVVDHLSFHVEKGKIYGFLGPNGAGKSTTMNMLTGYISPTEGTILVNGYDVQKEPEKAKKQIGYLPEMPPLYQDMNVLEYLDFVAELKKIPKDERKKQVSEVMEMTMITDMAHRMIKNLSKGYKQRVGLSQAILGYPDVIILDEPTVGLDPKQIIEIRDLIKRLGKEHTILLSSHILSEVSAICDYIMIISHGKLVASDTADGLNKLMKEDAKLLLTIKGSREEVEAALNDITYIEKVEFKRADVKKKDQKHFNQDQENQEQENQEIQDIIITIRSTTDGEVPDIRESLFYTLAEYKLPILSETYSTNSLEEIFLSLTNDYLNGGKEL